MVHKLVVPRVPNVENAPIRLLSVNEEHSCVLAASVKVVDKM
jgi:hypothetical protein